MTKSQVLSFIAYRKITMNKNPKCTLDEKTEAKRTGKYEVVEPGENPGLSVPKAWLPDRC